MDSIKENEICKTSLEAIHFDSAFDFERSLCRFSITNTADIEILSEKYDECLKLEDSEAMPNWGTPYFYEGASLACFREMKEAFELFKQGAIKAPWNVKKTSGTAIHINEKSYKSAINGKFYDLEEYKERIGQYNFKRGLNLNDLDSDGDLTADDVERLCEGLKTYVMEDIFPPYYFGKVKMQYYGNVEVEDANAE